MPRREEREGAGGRGEGEIFPAARRMRSAVRTGPDAARAFTIAAADARAAARISVPRRAPERVRTFAANCRQCRLSSYPTLLLVPALTERFVISARRANWGVFA